MEAADWACKDCKYFNPPPLVLWNLSRIMWLNFLLAWQNSFGEVEIIRFFLGYGSSFLRALLCRLRTYTVDFGLSPFYIFLSPSSQLSALVWRAINTLVLSIRVWSLPILSSFLRRKCSGEQSGLDVLPIRGLGINVVFSLVRAPSGSYTSYSGIFQLLFLHDENVPYSVAPGLEILAVYSRRTSDLVHQYDARWSNPARYVFVIQWPVHTRAFYL